MDLEQEISKALADPDIMNKVSSVLSSLGNSDNQNEPDSSSAGVQGSAKSLLSSIGEASDDRTRLLMAIKPFLSEKRAPYMDSAVTILRLLKMGKLGKDLKLF